MYKTRDQWSQTLRQGDVLGELPYPLLTNQATKDTPLFGGGSTGGSAIRIPVTNRYAVVVSHCCEFNPGKRSNFLVARVEGINVHQLSTDDIAVLKTGNDYEKSVEAGLPIQMDTYVLDPLVDCFTELRRVNFQTICSYPMTFLEDLTDLKKGELLDSERELFRRKLAMFFARPSEAVDEEAEEETAGETAVEESAT